MTVSSKGRYALRVMIDLAENSNGSYVSMRSIAGRQGISLKYIERILPSLTAGGMIRGSQGRSGGYVLTRDPSEYTVAEILHAAEGDLAPVACLGEGTSPCERADECRTLDMWRRYQRITEEFFGSIKLSDLMKK